MSYESLTNDLVTILRGMTRFANADISKGDDRILGHGKVDCIILYPGPFRVDDEGDISQGREDRTWTVYLDLFQRVKTNPGADWVLFGTARDDVISTLRQYPNLSQSTIFIKEVGVLATDPPQLVFDDNGKGPYFIFQRITSEIVENVTVSGGDYGA